MRRTGWVLSIVVPGALAALVLTSRAPRVERSVQAAQEDAAAEPEVDGDGREDDARDFAFRLPSGEPTALACEQARAIVAQVRAGLAYPPAPAPIDALGPSAADWLDPHGLLTLAHDAPTGALVARASGPLVADLEGPSARACASARAPAEALTTWVNELRVAFDGARESSSDPRSPTDETEAFGEPLPPTGNARETAALLGRRVGVFERRFGEAARPFADAARHRFFPPLDADGWAKVVLASVVRAYVPLVDPHGEWAPFDEESRVYEVDLSAHPPERLWSRAVSTAVGIRVTEPRSPALHVDDLVLAIAGVATAGLPLEQVDQLSFAQGTDETPITAVLVRSGELLTISLDARTTEPGPRDGAPLLPSVRIPYGDADVLVVDVDDVREDLGAELAERLEEERRNPRAIAGLVLDLRGNGGGSTDGAIGALGLFLPGAPLTVTRRRDGTVEVDHAPVPPLSEQWTGPVATFVDGTTASAAEMIAGSLAAYRRGPSVGTTTFGKGCAQEYVDDDAHAGILRLTTLLYALPDGTPVQRVGLTPQIRFPFTPREDSSEREATVPRTAPSFRGPDVRARVAREGAPSWPAPRGAIGPCADAEVCKALERLAPPKHAPVAKAR